MNPLLLSGCFMVSALIVGGAVQAAPEQIEFPANYKTAHLFYTNVDRPDNKTVRDLYANPLAANAAQSGRPLPSGSVLTMEVYKALLDERGEPLADAAGRFRKGELAAIVVMEKRSGWGSDYPEALRNGEWDYAKFTPTGELAADADATPCLQCHKGLVEQDYVFSLEALKDSR